MGAFWTLLTIDKDSRRSDWVMQFIHKRPEPPIVKMLACRKELLKFFSSHQSDLTTSCCSRPYQSSFLWPWLLSMVCINHTLRRLVDFLTPQNKPDGKQACVSQTNNSDPHLTSKLLLIKDEGLAKGVQSQSIRHSYIAMDQPRGNLYVKCKKPLCQACVQLLCNMHHPSGRQITEN